MPSPRPQLLLLPLSRHFVPLVYCAKKCKGAPNTGPCLSPFPPSVQASGLHGLCSFPGIWIFTSQLTHWVSAGQSIRLLQGWSPKSHLPQGRAEGFQGLVLTIHSLWLCPVYLWMHIRPTTFPLRKTLFKNYLYACAFFYSSLKGAVSILTDKLRHFYSITKKSKGKKSKSKS